MRARHRSEGEKLLGYIKKGIVWKARGEKSRLLSLIRSIWMEGKHSFGWNVIDEEVKAAYV